MRNLEQEDEDSFKRQFSKYIKLGVNADAVRIAFLFITFIGRPTKLLFVFIKEAVSKLDKIHCIKILFLKLCSVKNLF